jgi:two-component system, chemotaxis family, CheB/CheR fusion protein
MSRSVPQISALQSLGGGFESETPAAESSERERAEKELRERVEEIEALMEAVPAVVLIARDPECELITGNRVAQEALRMSKGENISKTAPHGRQPTHFKVMNGGKELLPHELPVQSAARGAEVRGDEHEVVFSDGERLHLYGNAVPLRDAAGNVRGAISAFVDITARVQAEESLRESERRFKTLADKIPALIWMEDERGRGVFANARCVEYTGLPEEELLGGWPDVIHPDDTERFLADCRSAKGRRAEYRDALRLRRHDGVYRWFEGMGLPRFEGGRFAGYVGCLMEAHDRKMAEESLREADRRKDEFLAMLSHELRNPLAPILNAVGVLKQPGLSIERLEWARGVIERQVESLTRLVDDLLDVSRITQGKIALRRENLDLAAVVARAIETSRPLIEARKHNLTVNLPSRSMRLNGDLLRLAQVISNLLNNAAKYTGEGGDIRLTAEAVDDEVILRVKDNGTGIPAEVLPRIFDLFIQADRSLDRAQGGLGIGLTLARGVVEMHGGQLEAFSDGPGRGSDFEIRLPALPFAPGETCETSVDVKGAVTAASKACRVLVVDDSADSAESLSVMLALEGHDTKTAHDGPSALELARAFRPQVTLLDIGLPGMSGYEVARRLRRQRGGRKTTLIAVSGYGQEEDRRKSREAGFDHHLTKPVNYDTLTSLINSLILK